MFFRNKFSKVQKIALPAELIELLSKEKNSDIRCDKIIHSNCTTKNEEEAFVYEPTAKYSLSCNEIQDDYINDLSKSFNEQLFEYIDRTGKKDSDIYKSALIDRKHFSKIRSDKFYHPSFKTVTMFAIALNLSIEEYETLLKSAAYSLPDNKREYKVLRYCFENEIYDIKIINNYLHTACDKTLNDV